MRITTIICALFFALVMLTAPASTPAQVSVGLSVGFAPPELPVYEQPICPGDGYIWTPGYWAWDPDGDDYYWVPGTWVLAPEVGFLWTPAWWGWSGSAFIFHEGYWGPHVGFYGGISYGFGYFGHGYEGGRWDNGHFFYNRSVNNVNVTEIHNVYNTTIVNRNDVRVSYNGGNGGINQRPTREEESYDHERHIPPVADQTRHMEAARGNPQLRATVNHGKPPIAATSRPGALNDRGAVAAKEGSYKAEASRPAPHAGSAAGGRTETNSRAETNAGGHNAVHPNELPPAEKHAAPNTGNAKLDQKYQQQQDKLDKQQAQEREKLQAQQEKEHQQLAKQNADEARKAQVEQKHQQQTQQMVQRHTQQQQSLQQKQQPAHASAPKGKH